jgi:hypothetical protein
LPPEAAREELKRDIAIPCYTEIVEATVTQRMSIATEATMSHLSNSVFMSHAELKAEQRSVGRYSPPEMKERADNQIRRLGDQIERDDAVHPRPHWDGPEHGP